MKIVTCLIFKKDNSNTLTRNIDFYLKSLDYISDLNIETFLYLDKSLSHLKFKRNIKAIPISVEELPLYNIYKNNVKEFKKGIGINYNPNKNTLDYMTIINSKPEFIYRSLDFVEENERVCWLDSGICHVLKTPEQTLNKIHLINNLEDGLIIPGLNNKSDNLEDVNWRFLGGFFTANKDIMKKFYFSSKLAIYNLFPIALWEVNVWAWMEVNMGFNFKWYQGGFNDSILDFDQFLIKI